MTLNKGFLGFVIILGIFSFSVAGAEMKVSEGEQGLKAKGEQSRSETDRIKRAQSENEQSWNDLSRKARLARESWGAIDDSLSLKQVLKEAADVKQEIAGLKIRLDDQNNENTRNLKAAYAEQRTLTKAKAPPLPAPKDAFESIEAYHNRIDSYKRQAEKAEAENDDFLEKLKKEEAMGLIREQAAYLGQQVRVLEPFVKRLQDLRLAMKKMREVSPEPSIGLSEIEQFDKLKQDEAKAKAANIRAAKIMTSKEIGADGRFIAYDDGTVLDTATNLFWAAKDSGKRMMTWQDAKTYCESYRGGGYTDWRMPTSDELAGLYDKKGKPNRYEARVTDLIEVTYMWVWASETSGSRAAIFGFRYGSWFWYPQSSSASHALPVRGGK